MLFIVNRYCTNYIITRIIKLLFFLFKEYNNNNKEQLNFYIFWNFYFRPGTEELNLENLVDTYVYN